MDLVKNLIQQVEKLKSEGKFEESIDLLQDAVLKYGDDYRIYEEIADIYLYKGKNKKAEKAVDFALKINPDSATGNYLKGFILLAGSKVEESINLLEKSNKLFPNNAEVLRNLGWAYTMVGEAEKGIFILKRALNISPGDKLIREDLAMALIGVGEIEKGNEILKQIGKQKLAI